MKDKKPVVHSKSLTILYVILFDICFTFFFSFLYRTHFSCLVFPKTGLSFFFSKDFFFNQDLFPHTNGARFGKKHKTCKTSHQQHSITP